MKQTLKTTAAVLALAASVVLFNACVRLACAVLYLTITRGELPSCAIF